MHPPRLNEFEASSDNSTQKDGDPPLLQRTVIDANTQLLSGRVHIVMQPLAERTHFADANSFREKGSAEKERPHSIEFCEGKSGTYILMPYVKSLSDIKSQLTKGEHERFVDLLARDGVKIIYAPILVVSPEEFVHNDYFKNAIAVDDLFPVQDQGEEHDHESTMKVPDTDGYGTIVDLPSDRRAVGHHSGYRFTQRASCDQFCNRIHAGAIAGLIKNGSLNANVWAEKRLDEDVVMTAVLAELLLDYLKQSDGDVPAACAKFAPGSLAHRLAQTEGKQDVFLGAADLPLEERETLKGVLSPVHPLKQMNGRVRAEDMSKVIEAVKMMTEQYLLEHDIQLPLRETFHSEEQKGWTYIPKYDPDARFNVRKASLSGFCVFKLPIENTVIDHYTVANWGRRLPMDLFYNLLNLGETMSKNGCPLHDTLQILTAASQNGDFSRATYRPWGGSEGGGCIQYGTNFSEKDLIVLINHIMGLLHQHTASHTLTYQRKETSGAVNDIVKNA